MAMLLLATAGVHRNKSVCGCYQYMHTVSTCLVNWQTKVLTPEFVK